MVDKKWKHFSANNVAKKRQEISKVAVSSLQLNLSSARKLVSGLAPAERPPKTNPHNSLYSLFYLQSVLISNKSDCFAGKLSNPLTVLPTAAPVVENGALPNRPTQPCRPVFVSLSRNIESWKKKENKQRIKNGNAPPKAVRRRTDPRRWFTTTLPYVLAGPGVVRAKNKREKET